MSPFIQSALALVTGGAIWEAFKFIYPEIKRPIDSRREAKKIFYQNIDPILKSASELYGKLLSLAKEDFATFINTNNSTSSDPEHNRRYIYYLFAQFWAQLEYLRLQNQNISFSKIKKGKDLLRYIETFEARKYRILDRSVQRVIGEHLISVKDQKFRIMTLHEFLNQIESDSSSLKKYISKLELKFSNLNNKEIRQEILIFGLIVASLIDHFDPNHTTIRQRPYFTNKLSEKSKKTIKNNLFCYYLNFVKCKERYFT